jgi:type IV secretory pathway TrbL component
MFPAFLIQIIVALIIVGLLLWLVTIIPMDPFIARLIRIAAVVGVVLWLIWLLTGVTPATAPLRR